MKIPKKTTKKKKKNLTFKFANSKPSIFGIKLMVNKMYNVPHPLTYLSMSKLQIVFSPAAPDVIPKNVKGVGTWRNNMEISWEVTNFLKCFNLQRELLSSPITPCVPSLLHGESGMDHTWNIWCGGEGEIPGRSGKTPPQSGWSITFMTQIHSPPMRSKSRQLMTLGLDQSHLWSLVILGKTVSTVCCFLT